jgi:hypothetical protein
MRREDLHVHRRGQLPVERSAQPGQPGARPVRGHRLTSARCSSRPAAPALLDPVPIYPNGPVSPSILVATNEWLPGSGGGATRFCTGWQGPVLRWFRGN